MSSMSKFAEDPGVYGMRGAKRMGGAPDVGLKPMDFPITDPNGGPSLLYQQYSTHQYDQNSQTCRSKRECENFEELGDPRPDKTAAFQTLSKCQEKHFYRRSTISLLLRDQEGVYDQIYTVTEARIL